MTALAWLALASCGCAQPFAAVRWLRVAQREHYLTGTTTLFAWRWWRSGTLNAAIALAAAAAAVLAWWWPVAGVVTALAVVCGPLGLSLRGRTSPLAWTRRLRTLGAAWLVVLGAETVVWSAVRLAAGTGAGVAGACAQALALGAIGAPLLVDAALALTDPVERRLARPYVRRATEKLSKQSPIVVAITGSYGKTSTKRYVAHLLERRYDVVASPASYNNRSGLARAVNEHLAPGTEVFVAEMGTYGPGEIRELCSWIPPDVAVITAIGPVHLERFGSEDRIVEAKSEIAERASCVVLAVDDPRLDELAARFGAEGKKVWRCSTKDGGADVLVRASGPGTMTVVACGEPIAEDVKSAARPGNVACAVAVALHLGVPVKDVATGLSGLPTVPHRLEPSLGAGGAVVLDDTYNSNPAGAAVALAVLSEASAGGRRVVVTPGMVELGGRQRDENARFAREAAAIVTDVLFVGRTNRASLIRGASSDGAPHVNVVLIDRRDQAVDWVRRNLGVGDAVLYENDLPDHYP